MHLLEKPACPLPAESFPSHVTKSAPFSPSQRETAFPVSSADDRSPPPQANPLGSAGSHTRCFIHMGSHMMGLLSLLSIMAFPLSLNSILLCRYVTFTPFPSRSVFNLGSSHFFAVKNIHVHMSVWSCIFILGG